MTNEQIRTIIKQLTKLKNIDRDIVVEILLNYIGNEYDLTRITDEILDIDNSTTIRGLWYGNRKFRRCPRQTHRT